MKIRSLFKKCFTLEEKVEIFMNGLIALFCFTMAVVFMIQIFGWDK